MNCDICVSQITMTTAWLLLLLLLIVSSRNVNCQSTTDDEETCADGGLLSKLQSDINTMLENQRQMFQTIMNRLGMFYFSVLQCTL